jgi:hypothetical protein
MQDCADALFHGDFESGPRPMRFHGRTHEDGVVLKLRGFISGTVTKKIKLAVESVRNEQGERLYKVK